MSEVFVFLLSCLALVIFSVAYLSIMFLVSGFFNVYVLIFAVFLVLCLFLASAKTFSRGK